MGGEVKGFGAKCCHLNSLFVDLRKMYPGAPVKQLSRKGRQMNLLSSLILPAGGLPLN